MEIQETRQGAVTVLKPQGPLALGDAEQFKRVIEESIQRSLGRLVVDASAIAYVDSRGLEVMVDASEALSQTGRSLRVCNTSETVREVLHLTGLEDRFEHFEDVNSAVRSFL